MAHQTAGVRSTAARPGREPVAPNDAAWLQDSPSNLMVINVILITDRIDVETVRRLFQRKVIEAGRGERWRRFRMRVIRSGGRAYWEEDPAYHIDRHIMPAPEQDAGTAARLQDYVSRIASEPLPDDRPRWQIQHVERFDGDGSALVLRIHHAMADGVALVSMILDLMDPLGESNGGGAGARPAKTRGAARSSTVARMLKVPLLGPFILLRRLSWRPDRSTLHGPRLSGRKRVAWTRSYDLRHVQVVKNRLGATINDVLMAVVCGGFGRYFARHGELVRRIRVSMPMNVRPPDERPEMENRVAPVMLELPVGIDDIPARVLAVKRRMDALKQSVEPMVIYGIVKVLLRALPHGASKALIDFLASKCTCVVTNVPGPAADLHLEGRRLRSPMFWVPQRADIGLGISILSFSGRVQIGVICDTCVLGDPAEMVQAFEEEFQAMLSAEMLSAKG